MSESHTSETALHTYMCMLVCLFVATYCKCLLTFKCFTKTEVESDDERLLPEYSVT